MDLPVVLIHGDDPNDGLAEVVSGYQHDARPDLAWLARVSQSRPAETVVIFGVEVGKIRSICTCGRLSGSPLRLLRMTEVRPPTPAERQVVAAASSAL